MAQLSHGVRLDERDIADLITAYHGVTAASPTAAYGMIPTSVTRLLHIAGVRRTPPT
jgi:hypothetical protein